MCQLLIAVSGPRRENRYVVVGALLLSSVTVYSNRHVRGDYIHFTIDSRLTGMDLLGPKRAELEAANLNELLP